MKKLTKLIGRIRREEGIHANTTYAILRLKKSKELGYLVDMNK